MVAIGYVPEIDLVVSAQGIEVRPSIRPALRTATVRAIFLAGASHVGAYRHEIIYAKSPCRTAQCPQAYEQISGRNTSASPE